MASYTLASSRAGDGDTDAVVIGVADVDAGVGVVAASGRKRCGLQVTASVLAMRYWSITARRARP